MATPGNLATNSGASGGTLDLSLTVQAADDMIIVGTSFDGDCEVSSVTIDPGGGNEAAFTAGHTVRHNVVGESKLWYLLAASIPPAGTYTIRLAKTVSVQGGAAYAQAMQGMVQEAPNATGGQSTPSGNTAAWDISLTGVTADSYVFDVAHLNNGGRTFTPDGSQVEILDASADGSSFGSYLADVSGSVAMGFTPSSSDTGTYAAAAFAVSAGGGATNATRRRRRRHGMN